MSAIEAVCEAQYDVFLNDRGKADRGYATLNNIEKEAERMRVRAALRALADQFNDPVVKSAILWAAKEGEKS